MNIKFYIIQKCASDLSFKYDLNVADFKSEIRDFKSITLTLLPDLSKATSSELFQLIHTYLLRDEYLNTEIALKDFLDIADDCNSVVSCEPLFSKF